MDETLRFKWLFLLLLFFIIIIIPCHVMAEQVLIKGEAKYYGWKLDEPGKFITCDGNVIDIGKGEVKDTDYKCDQPYDHFKKGKKAKAAAPADQSK